MNSSSSRYFGIACLLSLFLGSTLFAGGIVVVPLEQHTFVRGDITGDGDANVADAIGILAYLFDGAAPAPSCLAGGDVDANAEVGIGDAILLLGYLFNQGAQPSAPFPNCGEDPTGLMLGCTPTGGFCPPINNPPATQFIWPMPGQDADDWVINNYVDLGTGNALLDYLGGMKTYNNHRGIDIDVPTFRAMDADFPILAAAAGVVVATDDSHFDRNMTCTGNWNFVQIEHPDGIVSIYGHLKQGSVVVSAGQTVQAGDVIGVVGSSGCSTAPHLHFEVRDSNNNVIDPFLDDMFIDPPVYDTPLGFMDASLRIGSFTHVNMIKDPPPNIDMISPGSTLGVGLSIAGGMSGDSVHIRLREPNNTIHDSHTVDFDQVYRHSYWWWNKTIPSNATQGDWEVEILLNGTLVKEYEIFVGPIFSGFQQVRHGLPAADYQQTFDALVANGYRPVWVDGSDFNGNVYYNIVFDQSNPGPWVSFHNLTGSQYQTLFTNYTGQGYRLTHIDSYLSNGSVRYACIFVQQTFSPLWTASHNLTAAQFNSEFNTRVSQGYHPEVISVVDVNGSLRFTTLWELPSVGSWYAYYGMTSSDYQNEFTAQAAAGRELRYVNAYTDNNGVGRYVAVWSAVGPSAWVGRHNLTNSGFQSEFNQWSQIYNTRMVTAHETNNVFRYTGFWSN